MIFEVTYETYDDRAPTIPIKMEVCIRARSVSHACYTAMEELRDRRLWCRRLIGITCVTNRKRGTS